MFCVARSTKGKTTVVKKIIKDLKDKDTIVVIVSSHTDDFDKTNVKQKTIVIDKDNIQNAIDLVFSQELIDIHKVLFIDDATSLDEKNSNMMMKLLTQSRHVKCDVIFACHYINSFDIRVKSHITDYLIWGPISDKKLKEFYETYCADNLDCTAKGHEMNYARFSEMFYNQVQRVDIPRDSPEQEKYYHNYICISFPTVYDKTSVILVNDYTLKNSCK